MRYTSYRRMVTFALAVTTILGLNACEKETDECTVWSDCAEPMACRAGVCVQPELPQPTAWATRVPAPTDATENVLITGRLVSPPASSVQVGTFPTRMAIHPSGAYVAINENGWGTYTSPDRSVRAHYLRIYATDSGDLVSELRMPGDRMHIDLEFNATGDTLYVSGGQDPRLLSFAVSASGAVTYSTNYDLDDCFGTGIALNTDETKAYVSCYLTAEAMEVDLSSGALRDFKAGDWPYDIALTGDGKRLYISNAATGFNPEPGDTVTVVEVATARVQAIVPVGLGPQGMALNSAGNRLYVANNKTDDIHVIDTATAKVIQHISMHPEADGSQTHADEDDEGEVLKGSYPTALLLDEAAGRIYINATHENRIAVLDMTTGEHLGDIPTEWYPTHMALTPDRTRLAILSGYGRGDGPSSLSGRYTDGMEDWVSSGRQLHGSYFSIPTPTLMELEVMSRTVAHNNNVQERYFDLSAPNDSALPYPAQVDVKSPIEYVFFVFKENFTFDGSYGALGIGNGDPELQMWDEKLLVNQWALAREFTLFDNFFCNGEGSTDGHQWAAAGIEPDFMQRGMIMDYGDLGGPQVVVSLDPGTMPQSRLFLPHLLDQGIAAYGYGGLENFGAEGYFKYRDYWLEDYPWNLETGPRDEERARMFVDDFQQRVKNNTVARFNWIFFPNNHGLGLSKGEPTPESMVADNDLATGMVVDAVSNSPVWEKSLILVLEDDAQGAYDHVDKHRCPALAISPWVKRGHVSSVLYNFTNFHRTVEQLVGSEPMHRLDRDAVAMYDIFTARPDTRPYKLIPRAYPETLYDGAESVAAHMSRTMDWSDIDKDPRQAEFFWRYLKGTEPPARVRIR